MNFHKCTSYKKAFVFPDSETFLHSFYLSQHHLRRKGIAYLWAVIFMLLIILIVGLSIDTAKVCLVINQLHNAADAAALAGAISVKVDREGSREQSQIIAALNFADGNAVTLDLNEENDPNGDIVIGWYNRQLRTFSPAQDMNDPANSVMVVTSCTQENGDPVSLNFGTIVNVDTIDLTGNWQNKNGTYAIAMAAGGTGAGMIALAPDGRGVEMNGDFTLSVQPLPPAQPGEGEVQINSGDDDALTVIGNSTQIDASAINIWGDAYLTSDELEIPYTTDAPPLPDPLGSLPPPDYSELADLTAETKLRVDDPHPSWERITINSPDPNGNPWEIYPGYYAGGFYIDGGDAPDTPSVHFNPGVYVLGGSSSSKTAGLCVQAGGYGISDEAMFHIVDDGIVDIQGNGGLRATPPISGVYEGVTIFQARDNFNEAWIQGTADLELDGTLYFPRAEFLHILGGGWGFGNQLIGYRFEIQGSGIVGIQYDGRNRAPTTSSFLVE
ncbi:pilus assembly protein TadG-related protein [Planctomycetota bacterium]